MDKRELSMTPRAGILFGVDPTDPTKAIPVAVNPDGSLQVAGGTGGGGGSSNGLTDTQLRAVPVPVTGGLTDTQLRAAPVAVKQAGIVFSNSNGNNSGYQLSPGSSFVGSWEDIFNQPAIQVLADFDQPMKFIIEQAIDSGGLDIISITTFVKGSKEKICENVQLNGNYVRVTATNIGKSATTSFNLVSTFGPLNSIPTALTNNGALKVAAKETQNFTRKLRDAFRSWPNDNWASISKASGDIIQLDGNSAGVGYLVMSLDPLTAGTESYIESNPSYAMPLELAVGLHTSQRAYGQEISVAAISNDTTSPIPADLAISSISQATTTLTINTTLPHNLRVGQRFGIYGCSDSRMNYAALVVSATPSDNQLLATAGPQGTITSVTAGPFTSGFVYYRDAMHGAGNGTSMILENAAATNASFYVKAEGGDPTPIGGAYAGSHSVTIATTTSAQAVASAINYAFRPITQFGLVAQSDRIQWHDASVDALSQSTNRALMAQVCPHPDNNYAIRFAIKNRKGLTIPVAKIVSAAKTGTTTATVITNVAHGLTTGDYINAFGARDQTNFANLSAATVVASVVNSTTFTVVWGAAVTAKTYGGYVARVQGSQVIQGAISQSVQSASITNSRLTLIGSSAWVGFTFGDYINLHGCRDNTSGADVNIDGVYRVRDFSTTTLVLEPVGNTSIPASLASVNCGGAIIKRTDLRLSFVRLFDYERLRVESLGRPASDSAYSFPVVVQNSLPTGSNTIGNVGIVTNGNSGFPGAITDVASAALTTTTTTSAMTPTYGVSYEVNIPVTAVSGTAPTLDISIEESDDSGTNWFKVYDFPRISASGMYRSPKLPLTGNRVRYVQTVAGTNPSFTRAINRNQCSDSTRYMRQLIDRSVTLTTLSSTTPSINAQQCRNVQLVINIGTATTAPALQLQGSDDNGATWYAIGSALTAVASSTVQTTVNNIQSGLVRAIVTTAGATVVAGYVCVKAF